MLIGYRGCGKTTVGKLLAQKLGTQCVDTDVEVVAAAGMSIADIFASEGEDGFRRRESAVIERIVSTENAKSIVISLGGGAILVDINMTRLKPRSHIVWLTCPPEVLHERIARDSHTDAARPALTSIGGIEEIRAILAQREPLYKQYADVERSSQNRSPEDLATEIAAWNINDA